MIMKRGSDLRLLEKRLHASDQRERHSLETRRSSSRKYVFPGRAADRDTRSPDICGTRVNSLFFRNSKPRSYTSDREGPGRKQPGAKVGSLRDVRRPSCGYPVTTVSAAKFACRRHPSKITVLMGSRQSREQRP